MLKWVLALSSTKWKRNGVEFRVWNSGKPTSVGFEVFGNSKRCLLMANRLGIYSEHCGGVKTICNLRYVPSYIPGTWLNIQ